MTKTEERTEERRNRFNGESVMLTKEEAIKHDQIFMAEMIATIEDRTLGQGMSKHWETMRKMGCQQKEVAGSSAAVFLDCFCHLRVHLHSMAFVCSVQLHR